jgi:tRNA A37 threonylcarbamoyladenosine dehydratase
MLEERLTRTIALLGKQKANTLFSSTVMIIGLGAVGGYALEMLARLGISNLILVDFDTFETSNINRQILALTDTINQKKCDIAKERVLKINPDCNVIALDIKLTPSNLDFIKNYKPDFIIDAIDDISAKTSLIEYLVNNEIPFISAMGAALKFNPELLKTTTLDQTSACHLAKKLRENLRKKNVPLKKVPVVFSTEPSHIIKDENNQNILGSLPLVPMAMGASLAHFALKKIIKED